MKKLWATILTIASFSLFAQSSQAISEYTLKNKKQNNLSIDTSKSPVLALTSKEIAAKGKTFTVIVKCATQSGSGVIIENKNNTYTVITNWHVVDEPDEYIIITPDKKEYKVPYNKVKRLPGYDLATLEFTSKIKYAKAKIRKSGKLTEGDNIYITGFPGAITGIPEKVYSFTNSTINQLLSKGEEGYTLTYNNFGIHGTSGGAVLDEDGYLVGINGQIAYDETTSKSFGRGIPIETFLAKKNQFESLENTAINPLSQEDEIISSPKNEIISSPNIITTPLPNIDNIAGNTLPKPLPIFKIPKIPNNIPNRQIPNNIPNRIVINRNSILPPLPATISPQKYREIAKYDQALLNNPNDVNAYYQRGIIYFESKLYYSAINDFDEVIKRDSQNADAYVYRGNIYDNLQEYQKALLDYTQAIKINPDYAIAYNNRGNTYYHLEEYQKALSDFNQVIKINPDYAYAYYGRGLTYYNLEEYQKALSDYTQAIKINPNDADAYYNRSLTYQKIGEKEKALADFRTSASIYQKEGKTEDYQDAMERIRKLEQ